MSDDDLVSLRTGWAQPYFEALEDMADDGYFGGNFSEGIRSALPGYKGDFEFPAEDFGIYAEARLQTESEDTRERLLDEKLFNRAIIEMLERQDYEGAEELAELYRCEKLGNPI